MNKIDMKTILKYFLLSRIFIIIFMILSFIKYNDISFLQIYDCEHYLHIAEFGYTFDYLYAFFPLYPLIIKIFSYVFVSYELSGFIISNIFAFLTTILISKFNFKKENLNNIRWYLFSPILLFTGIVYTESLFIFLTLLGYYLYKEKKYWLASIIVGLCILTRNSGFILLLAIGIDMFYQKYKTKKINVPLYKIILYALIATVIGSIYPIYLKINTGSFITFASIQNTIWGRVTITPIQAIIDDIKYILVDSNRIYMFYMVILNWASYIYAIIIGIKIFKKDLVASLYLLISIAMFSFSFRDITYWDSISSISLFRYLWALFPLFMYRFNSKRNILFYLLLMVSIYNIFLYFMTVFIA